MNDERCDRDRVTAILTLADAATKQPWKWGWLDGDARSETYTVEGAYGELVARTSRLRQGYDDAEYIVAACNAFPDVAAALLEALVTIDKAKALHQKQIVATWSSVFSEQCGECSQSWPCPTWQALGGNESGDDR